MPIVERRNARRLFNLNALLWGLGSGLVSTALITYLIRDLCRGYEYKSVGLLIGWVLAAPRIAGLFRLFTPALIDLVGSRKRFCIGSYLTATLFLAAVPLAIPAMIDSENIAWVLLSVIALWCLYHLFEYCGAVALWAWFGDMLLPPVRGRCLGRREAWYIAGVTLGFLCAGVSSYYRLLVLPPQLPRWSVYLPPCYWGILFFLLSTLPLARLPEIAAHREPKTGGGFFRRFLAPLRYRRFVWLVCCGCWLQMAIGLTQSAQYRFQIDVLAISLLLALGRDGLTRIGQWLLGPTVGRWIDRYGNRRVVAASLFVAATGSLFYFFAEPETWWLVYGAAVAWIFWVGFNVGVANTILWITPKEERAESFAIYYAACGVVLAVTTLFGGWLTDLFRESAESYERFSFLLSWALRVAAIPLFWWASRPALEPCETAESGFPPNRDHRTT